MKFISISTLALFQVCLFSCGLGLPEQKFQLKKFQKFYFSESKWHISHPFDFGAQKDYDSKIGMAIAEVTDVCRLVKFDCSPFLQRLNIYKETFDRNAKIREALLQQLQRENNGKKRLSSEKRFVTIPWVRQHGIDIEMQGEKIVKLDEQVKTLERDVKSLVNSSDVIKQMSKKMNNLRENEHNITTIQENDQQFNNLMLNFLLLLVDIHQSDQEILTILNDHSKIN